jgi:serine/threonine protein kinase/Tol biopolymer transport system component
MIGSKLGPYEITAKLGEGGMGEVYRASDSRLKRSVAIKVLPPAFGWDEERRQRFEREAQILAQLHHPNIAAIYGLEDNGGVHALVMELVEGEDLSALIARGPLPYQDAVAIALQVAAALEAAHEHGVVHRDLKPANIKVTPEGVAKVLDFGLAKAVDPSSPSNAAMMNSPTLTARATQLGVVLGTAAYMAPEQAKGKSVDRRADIWAFGVVLFEMLTGTRAFAGEDTSELMASVLKSDPEWGLLPPDTPAPLRRLLRRCLEKDPRKRLSAIGDARLELQEEEPALAPGVPTASPARGRSRIAWLGWIAAALLAVGLIAVWGWPATKASPALLARLSVSTPSDAQPAPDSNQVSISPDGKTVAYVSGTLVGGNPQVWLRPLDSLTGRRIDNSDAATLMFWAPDSQSLGFWADHKLKRVAVATGRVQVIAEMSDFRGGTWSTKDEIVFASDAAGPLWMVPATGGSPRQVTKLDPAKHESGHRFPSFLPDGEHFLYAALPPRAGSFEIYVGSLHDAHRKLVGLLESAPIYVGPNWLLFLRHQALAAQHFDLDSMQLVGSPITTSDEPFVSADPTVNWTAGPGVSVSNTGSLAYYTSGSTSAKLVLLDATGTVTRDVKIPKGPYITVATAPDGRRAAVVRAQSEMDSQIWVADLEGGGSTAVTSERGCNGRVVWSPDGSRLLFSSEQADGQLQIYMKDLTDSGRERVFYQSGDQFKTPYGWSQDGKWIIIGQLNPVTLQDIYLLPAAAPTKLQPYYLGPGREEADALSPDGHWLLYTAENSGNWELALQSFPQSGHPVHVATAAPKKAWWSADQRHVYYVDYTFRELMTVDVEPGNPPRFGTPRLSAKLPGGVVDLDAMPDRRSWLALVTDTGELGSITVVQNWLANLGK